MKRLLVILVLIVSLGSVQAQQEPLLTQYYVNGLFFNPAVAGSDGGTTLQAHYRDQWVRFPGAPKTINLSAHTLIGGLHGIGAVLYHDQEDLISRTGGQLGYAFHIPINNSKLALGVAAKYFNFDVDWRRAQLENPNEPLLNAPDENVFDANLGAYFYHDKYFIGVSAVNLIEGEFGLTGDGANSTGTDFRHFYGEAGYKFDVGARTKLQPSVLVKMRGPADVQLDGNLKAFFLDEQIMFGAGYRGEADFVNLIGMLGFKLDDELRLQYSFDFNPDRDDVLQDYSFGSHGLMIGYDIGAKAKRMNELRNMDMEEEADMDVED